MPMHRDFPTELHYNTTINMYITFHCLVTNSYFCLTDMLLVVYYPENEVGIKCLLV